MLCDELGDFAMKIVRMDTAMNEQHDDSAFGLFLFLLPALAAFSWIGSIRRKRKLAARSRTEQAQEAIDEWRHQHEELQEEAGIKELAKQANAKPAHPIFAGAEPAKDRAEEERRWEIEAHDIRLHFHQATRKLYFSVPMLSFASN
jgi:hypothetical protein